LIALSTANKEFVLHDFHYDSTHLIEWTLKAFGGYAKGYFEPMVIKKDCAMFKYFPLNLVLSHFLKPDLTFIGKKKAAS
jgi:hypothetical protein